MRKYKPLSETELKLLTDTSNSILRTDLEKSVSKSGVDDKMMIPRQVESVCKAIHIINVAFKKVKGVKV